MFTPNTCTHWRGAGEEQIDRWSRDRECDNTSKECQSEHRSEHKKSKIEGRMREREHVTAPGLVCARSSSACPRSLSQVPVAGFNLTYEQRQRSMSWPQGGKSWSDHSEGLKSSSAQHWSWIETGNSSLAGKEVTQTVRTLNILGERKKVGKSQAPRARGETVENTG